jgi:hypothetical protein
MRGDQATDNVSYTNDTRFEQPTHDPRSDIRAVAAIQRRIIKQGKRNVALRYLHAKNDKEMIAAWKLDLIRIVDVFNVRSI